MKVCFKPIKPMVRQLQRRPQPIFYQLSLSAAQHNKQQAAHTLKKH